MSLLIRSAERGERPAHLCPMTGALCLGVNLTTAKALGLTISKLFLLRADEVIE